MITINQTSPASNGHALPATDNELQRAGCVRVVDNVPYRSYYTADCPRCKQPIELGQRVALHARYAKNRTRWAHVDCTDPNCGSRPASECGPDARRSNGYADPAEAAPADNALLKELLAKIKTMDDALGITDENLCDVAKVVKVLKNRIPREVVIRKPDGTTKPVEGCVHPVFEAVVQMATARKPIFLPGPSGSGKSHLAQQVAEALELSFASISCSAGMSESQLLGRMVPIGDHGQFEFLTTPFLEAFEKGGVFLFDELDAADSNVLLVINSALANGHLSVPSRHDKPVAKKHPDFVCIAAANTFGNGADRQYVGRNQLDAATLDRFRIGTVIMDYDRKLETQLCPNEKLRERLWSYRDKVASNRLQRIVSMRFLIDAYDMVANYGWTLDQVDAQLFAGWRADEVAKVKS